MAEKVGKLAKRLLAASMTAAQAQDWQDGYEEMIQAELKPLLDAAQTMVDEGGYPTRVREKLGAELQGWATQRGGANEFAEKQLPEPRAGRDLEGK